MLCEVANKAPNFTLRYSKHNESLGKGFPQMFPVLRKEAGTVRLGLHIPQRILMAKILEIYLEVMSMKTLTDNRNV